MALTFLRRGTTPRPSASILSRAERSFGALLLIGSIATLWTAPNAAAQTNVGEVIGACEDAVVSVGVFFDRPAGAPLPQNASPFVRVLRPSCGVIISASGLVLTNAHLVAEVPNGPLGDNPEYWTMVTRANGVTYEAQVIARDERLDLALLQLDVAEGITLPALPLGSVKGRKDGERVIALSLADRRKTHAFAGALAFASGSVQLREATLEAHEVVNSDARFHDLLDGGPLVDTRGQILAIHNNSHISTLPPGFNQDPDSDEPPPPSKDYAVLVSADAIRGAFAEQLDAVSLPEIPIDEHLTDPGVEVVGKIAPSVVSVWTVEGEEHPVASEPADPQVMRLPETLGSGVIVNASGLVLTSSDLFDGDNTYASVRLATGEVLQGTAVKVSRLRNAALVQLEVPEGMTLVAAELADAPLQGEYVAVVARPHGSALTLSIGVLSALERQGRMQLASWVHAGHWGGALVDRTGRLVGIAVDQPTVADRADSESFLGFAAPIATLREAFEDEWPTEDPDHDSEDARRNAVAKVVAATQSSLVNVLVSQAAPKVDTGFDPFAEVSDDFQLLGQGSGVIIHESGLAISNWHVVDAAMMKDGSQSADHEVKVTLPDGREFQVHVLSTSRDDDLALLKILLPPGETVTPVELGDSDSLGLGDVVIAIGNPLGLANSASAGIISALDLEVQIRGRMWPYEGMVMTDAAINPGNSGGALLNEDGKLVGINSAGRTGAGMAIPVNKAKAVFSGKLLSAEKLRSAYLGLTVRENDKGLRITHVDPSGPGATADLHRGDYVQSIGGADVHTDIAFAEVQLGAHPGTPLEITVKRRSEMVNSMITPLSFAAWTIFRQCGVEVEAVDFASETDLVRNAGIALHRAYTGNPNATPSSLMGGALRVTQAQDLDDDHIVTAEPGDLLLGMTTIIRGLENDSTELTRFERIEDLAATMAKLATREGNARSFWFLRNDQVIEIELFAKRP